MTMRNLDAPFEPRSIALFGASNQPGPAGPLLRNLPESSFKGPAMAVNPHEQANLSSLSCPSAALPPIPGTQDDCERGLDRQFLDDLLA